MGSLASGCLCGFDDWDSFYLATRSLLTQNAVPWLAAIQFWSGDRYELSERIVDPDDPESCTPLGQGELVVLQTVPPEQRRHRLVVRALARAVGEVACLQLKNERELHGTLDAFDPTSEVGKVDGEIFVAAQVLTVSVLEEP